MFRLERHMAGSVTKWLVQSGLTVKSEFVTPSGICDLVGIKLNPERVRHRIQLKQRESLNSIVRASILLRIPDVKARKSVSLTELVEDCKASLPEELIHAEITQLINHRFVVFTKRGRLQKMNGWMPLQERLVAVELKLHRIEEALNQAKNNLAFATESYVGLPATIAERVASNHERWDSFFSLGIGLLAVTDSECRALIPSSTSTQKVDYAVQLYCVEKFWRTTPKA